MAADTLYEIDELFKVHETDQNLEQSAETFGTRRIGTAIIGVGRMGAIHLYNIVREPRANLLYLLDASQERLDYMRKKYFLDERGVKCILPGDYNQVLEDSRVEALLVSTPTYTHAEFVKGALENGKHVICEKPLSDSPEEISMLMNLAQERQLKLICAFNRRYDPSFRRIREQLKRGDIGELRLIKTCSRDSPLPPIEYIKISGGIFHDCLVHDIDVILWMAQELPVEVHSYAHCYAEDYKALNDFDTVLTSMRFKSGLMSVTDLSRVSSMGYEQRVEVYGPKGCLKMDELSRVGWEKHNEMGITRPSNCFSFASRYLEAYRNEIVELFNHIEGNQVLEPINPKYLNVICKIIQACEHSARAGVPVKLEWSADELENSL